VFSSRKTERASFEDVAFRILAAGEHPHLTTINEFRRTHRASFADLFQQVLTLCKSAGLVKLGHVAIDGTKMKANARKHKAMSYERMAKEEARLKAEVEQLISQAEAADDAEDKLYGVGQQPTDLPAELERREGRALRHRWPRPHSPSGAIAGPCSGYLPPGEAPGATAYRLLQATTGS
jgi:hypothetical protein